MAHGWDGGQDRAFPPQACVYHTSGFSQTDRAGWGLMGEQENSKQPRRRAAAALGFVGLSVTAGVLVSAMLTPVVAVAGVATETGLHLFETMPEALTPDALAQTTDIYAKNHAGEPVLLASVYDQNRKSVSWEAISPFVKDALVSTEDPRFYTHGGVDIPSALRAAIGNAASGEVGSGASTITMQYVKNILVQRAEAIRDKDERAAAYTEATKTSMDRKLREMRLAIGLEKALTKDQIMLGYLNIAHFGGTVYGIEAAAEYYFGVTAADLTLAQAASLVATVNAPNDFRIDEPDNLGDNKYRRDNDVLAAMLHERKITQTQHDEAAATPIEPNITPPSTGCHAANPLGAGFFCDYVQWVITNEKVLPDASDPEYSTLATGGYDIYTTLDLDLQASAVAAVDAYVPRTTEVLDLGASLVTVEPGTGRILAMAQNKEFNADPEETSPENTAVNYGTDFDYGGSSGFQAGSTYKVFTLAEWLKDGRSLNDVVNGDSRALQLSSFKDSCQGASGGTYTPKNDGGQKPGNISVRSATAQSVNGAYFSMAQKLLRLRRARHQRGLAAADGRGVRGDRQPGRPLLADRDRPHRRARRGRASGAAERMHGGRVAGSRGGHGVSVAGRCARRHRARLQPVRRRPRVRKDGHDRLREGHLVRRIDHPADHRGLGRQRERGRLAAAVDDRRRQGRPAPPQGLEAVHDCGEQGDARGELPRGLLAARARLSRRVRFPPVGVGGRR